MSHSSVDRPPLPEADFGAVLRDLHPAVQLQVLETLKAKNPRPSHVVLARNAFIGEGEKLTIYMAGEGTSLGDVRQLRLHQTVGGLPSQMRSLCAYAAVPDDDLTAWRPTWADPRNLGDEVHCKFNRELVDQYGADLAAWRSEQIHNRQRAFDALTAPLIAANVRFEHVAVFVPRWRKQAVSCFIGVHFTANDNYSGYQLLGESPPQKNIYREHGNHALDLTVGGYGKLIGEFKYWILHKHETLPYLKDETSERQRLPVRIVR